METTTLLRVEGIRITPQPLMLTIPPCILWCVFGGVYSYGGGGVTFRGRGSSFERLSLKAHDIAYVRGLQCP